MTHLLRSQKKLIFLLIISGLILFYKIDKPFVGIHDWNSAYFGSIARAFNRGDFSKIAPHHPFLLPLLSGFSFKIFGVHEYSLRLIPVFFSLGAVVFLTLLAENLLGKSNAVIPPLFFIASPLFIYYGKLPVTEVLVLFFSLGSFYFYRRWITNGRQIYFFRLLVFIFLGQLSGWPGYYLPIILIIHGFFALKGRFKRKIFLLLPLSLISLIVFFLYLKIFTKSWHLNDLFEIFLFRANLDGRNIIFNFTLKEYLIHETRWIVVHFTKIVSILAFLGLLICFKDYRQRKNFSFFLALFLFGILHLIIFPNHSYIHEYTILFLTPFITLSAALPIAVFSSYFSGRKIVSFIFLAFILFLILSERWVFTRTLLTSRMNQQGFELGMIINQTTKPKEKILIADTNIKEFYEVFIAFYSDREVEYQNYSDKELLEKYRFIILPLEGGYTEKNFRDFLFENYSYREKNGFTFFDTKRRKNETQN